MGTLVQIVDSPVLAKTYRVPSRAHKRGAQPLVYGFRKGGKPTEVHEEDVEMLLGLSRRTTGPGGKGRAEVSIFELTTDVQRVQSLSTDEKLSRILKIMEDRGIDVGKELLREAADDAGEAPNSEPTANLDDDPDEL